MSIRILHVSGIGPFGGASRSLFEVLQALPEGAVESHFFMPPGTALDALREIGVDAVAVRGLTRFDHTRASHYRGIRWIVMLRELFHAPFMLLGLLKARRRWRTMDAIHAIDFPDAVTGAIAARLFRAPLIIHARALAMNDRRLFRTRLMHRLLRKAKAIIAIDQNVRETLPADLPITIIHNCFDPGTGDAGEDDHLSGFERLRAASLKIGFVGNIMKIKGIVELVEAAILVKQAGHDVQYLIVGGAFANERSLFRRALKLIGLDQNVDGKVRSMIAENGLADDFVMIGHSRAIHLTYRRMDVLAFPSHLDAPGRPVLEAAFFGVPSIVAVKKPRDDTIVQGETGIVIERPHAELLAKAIGHFAADHAEIARMGANARALAERNFVPASNARALLALYRQVIGEEAAGVAAPAAYSRSERAP